MGLEGGFKDVSKGGLKKMSQREVSKAGLERRTQREVSNFFIYKNGFSKVFSKGLGCISRAREGLSGCPNGEWGGGSPSRARPGVRVPNVGLSRFRVQHRGGRATTAAGAAESLLGGHGQAQLHVGKCQTQS